MFHQCNSDPETPLQLLLHVAVNLQLVHLKRIASDYLIKKYTGKYSKYSIAFFHGIRYLFTKHPQTILYRKRLVETLGSFHITVILMVHELIGLVCSLIYMFLGSVLTQIPWLHKYSCGYVCLKCLFHTIEELKFESGLWSC